MLERYSAVCTARANEPYRTIPSPLKKGGGGTLLPYGMTEDTSTIDGDSEGKGYFTSASAVLST